MDIDSLRYYFQQELPRHLVSFFGSLSDTLAYVPYYVYLAIILIFVLSFALLARRVTQSSHQDQRRQKLTEKLAQVKSAQDLVPVLYHFFKESNPSIRNIGIYTKTGDTFRLLNAESLEDGATESALDTIIRGKPGYDRIGRFHYYTYIPESEKVAVRLVSLNKANIEDMKAELQYLTAYLENFIETDSLRTEVFKSRLIDASREIFMSSSQNRTEYFTFVANIIKKANSLDGIVIETKSGNIAIGNTALPETMSKLLYVRNSDVRIRIYRSAGISPDDAVSVGKFLDLISATLALYTDKYLVYNYLYFLETAVSIHEKSDRFYHRHSEKVTAVCLGIAGKLGLDKERIVNLQYAARLHDIGMMGDLLDLAGRETRFTDKEYALLRYHPLTGAALVAPIDSTHPISTIIVQHHEALDGTGYPNGIHGERILPESKILGLSEMFIGLISDRAHRRGISFDDAITGLGRMVPNKIDPEVFRAFVEERTSILQDLRKITESSS